MAKTKTKKRQRRRSRAHSAPPPKALNLQNSTGSQDLNVFSNHDKPYSYLHRIWEWLRPCIQRMQQFLGAINGLRICWILATWLVDRLT
jgi:hypothetical protein